MFGRYDEWPRDALEAVARSELANLDEVDQSTLTSSLPTSSYLVPPSYLLTFLPSSFPPLLSVAQRNVALRAPNKGFGNQPSESKQHSTHEAVKLAQAALIP